MSWLALASRPFVKLLSASTDLVLKVMGVDPASVSTVTEEEIHAMLAEGSDAGVIEQNEHAMVRNVFRLDERQISSLMVPRSDVVYLDVEESVEENLAKVAETDHSRFPVCRGGLDDVIGFVHTKQLLAQSLRGQAIDFTQHLQEILYVPETLTGMELLENIRSSNTQIALVLDEYGEVQGLITLQDLLEAITGEFASPGDENSWALQRDDGSWLLDGLIPIPELKDRLQLRSVPEEEKARYQALERHADAGARENAADRRHHRLGKLEARGDRHGRQAHRQGARDAGLDRPGAGGGDARARAGIGFRRPRRADRSRGGRPRGGRPQPRLRGGGRSVHTPSNNSAAMPMVSPRVG